MTTFRLHLVTRGFEPIVYAIGECVNAAVTSNVDVLGLPRPRMEFVGTTHYFLFRGEHATAVVVGCFTANLRVRIEICSSVGEQGMPGWFVPKPTVNHFYIA
ncbi:hypothetical protein P3T43_004572 [Paraburkholderia sp. GAS41]|jgi:hypothetical protein|uniref:hypothetical protein n=1 Tax=Paraburkholderia sp. GAS41 TaxID=3035134 RepID=UPI003D233025